MPAPDPPPDDLDRFLDDLGPPRGEVQAPPGPPPALAARGGPGACPKCRSVKSRAVARSASRAPGRIAYRVCRACGCAHAPPPDRYTGAVAWCTGLGLVVATVVGGVTESLAVVLLLGVGLAVTAAVTAACARQVAPTRSRALTLVPDDGGRPSDGLRKWIADNRRRRVRRAARVFVRWGGLVVTGVGSALCLGGVGLVLSAVGVIPSPAAARDLWCVVPVLVPVMLGLGTTLYRLGKVLSARRATDVLSPAGPRPVLLLRAFHDDHARSPGGDLDGETDFNLAHAFDTLEDRLVRVYAGVAPVVAVGRPGDVVRPGGAAREYLDNDDWKAWVAEFLVWSQQVVMLLGPRPRPVGPSDPNRKPDGLEWEIRHVFRAVPSYKVVVVIPPQLAEEEVRARWAWYADLLGERFPRYHPGAVLVRYDADGTAGVVCRKNLRALGSKERARALVSALAAARDWTDPVGLDVARVGCGVRHY